MIGRPWGALVVLAVGVVVVVVVFGWLGVWRGATDVVWRIVWGVGFG